MRARAGALVALLVAACAKATGDVTGGEPRFDAAPAPEPPVQLDAADDEAGEAGDSDATDGDAGDAADGDADA
jgi:hypothetical protein